MGEDRLMKTAFYLNVRKYPLVKKEEIVLNCLNVNGRRFRDALRNNPDLAKEYHNIKERLAKEYPDSREKYTEGKTKFIMDVMK